MKKIKKILIAAFSALAVCAGVAVVAGCTTPDGGEFKINSVSGIESRYAIDDIIDATQIMFDCTDENGNKVTVSYNDMEITGADNVTFGDTGEEGVYSFTATYKGATFTFSYYVSANTLVLDFNGGTYNGSETQEIICGASGADVSIIFTDKIVAPAEGYAFAGWFYDKEGTERVTLTDNVVDTEENTTLYACYDKDWSDLYTYEVANGEVTLLKANYKTFYTRSLDGEYQMIIPATVDLYPVTALADNFIYDGITHYFFEEYTELVFEDGSSVKTIGDYAFTNLYFRSITLPESLERIGDHAFAENNSLAGTLTLNKNLVSIGTNAFSSTALEAIDAVEGCALTEIGERAFIYCSELKSVTFPDKLTTIGENVFENCSGITSLHIPASVTNIALGAFSSMGQLEEVTVAKGNTSYLALNGDLYRRDGENLSLYRYCYGYGGGRVSYCPVSSEYGTIISISKGAFSLDYDTKRTSLKNIYMDGVITINESAFFNCAAQVWIADSVKTIAVGAFEGYAGDGINLGNNYATTTKTANDAFSVDEDGVLYSADGKELICILKTYSKEKYTLPANVETIRSGALIRNDNIYILEIPADSKLTSVKANAIQIGSMNSLCGIYCYKAEPFTLADSAFDSENNFGTPYIYVDSSVYDDYAAAWASYVGYVSEYGYSGQSVKTKIGVSDILTTPEKYAKSILSDISGAGYTSYEAFKKGVSGRPTDEYSANTSAYYNAFREALSACIMLDTTSEYADYLYGYAANFIKFTQDSYHQSYLCEYIIVWENNTDATKNAAANLSSYFDKVAANVNGTANVEDPAVTELNQTMSGYTYDAENFSATEFEPYYNAMNTEEAIALGGYIALNKRNAINFLKGEASYLIEKAKSLGTITVKNYKEATMLVWGDNATSSGIYGDIYILCWTYAAIEYDYDVWDLVCDDTVIAGYSDYLAIKDELNGDIYAEFVASMVTYIEEFKITSTYDKEKYDEFMENYLFIVNNSITYDWINGLAEKGLCHKYNAILSSYYIHGFLTEYAIDNSTHTDEEIDAEGKAIYEIAHSDGIYYLQNYDKPSGFTIDDVEEYESWIIDLETFDEKHKALQQAYDKPVTELKAKLDKYIARTYDDDGKLKSVAYDYDSLTLDEYNAIIALEESAQVHISDLYSEDTSYKTFLTGIRLWKAISDLKAAYPDPASVTDYDGLYKLLYSYYDVENKTYVQGLDYYYNLGLEYGQEVYSSYVAVFAEEAAL